VTSRIVDREAGDADPLAANPGARRPGAAPSGAATAESIPVLESRLRHAVAGEVRVDPGTRALYASDASNYRVLPAVVVAPRSVEDLVAIVGICREARVPVTMRGAGTSLAGNAIGTGVVVDTSRHLDAILDIDPVAGTATVQPGVVLDVLNAAAARHGLRFGPDPSTRSRCTVGGMIGNNACGSHSVVWGTTAQNVLGLDLVTADGERRAVGTMPGGGTPALGPVLESRLRAFSERHRALIRRELPPWPRRVSGYSLDWLLPERGFDVARALVGSEGTCAVVSAATIRLVRPPAARVLLALGFADDIEAASAVTAILTERPFTVESMTAEQFGSWRDPEHLLPSGRAWLLVEAGGESAAAARGHGVALAGTIGRRPGDASVALMQDLRAQQALWRIREDGAGRSARLADGSGAWPGFEDAAVPPARLPAFLVDLRALLRDHGLRGTTYGHFGEGCVHLRAGFGLDRPGGEERLGAFMDAAADLVVSHGGTLSGEHGDGRARSALLPKMFSPAMIGAFAQFKAIWDPGCLLNPGIVVDPDPVTASLRRPRPTMLPVQPAFAYEGDGADFRSAVERCTGVGRCVAKSGAGLMCPSYRATGREEDSTRGRARLLQEMLAGSLAEEGWRSTDVRDALDLCLSCRGCLSECPTGVDMATYKSEFLDHHYRGRLRPRSHYSLGWLPTWLRFTHRVPRMAGVVNAVMRLRPTRLAFARIAGIAGERAIPPLAAATFVRTHRPEAPPPQARGRVILWPDTFNNHLSPAVAHAAVRVLRSAAFDVVVPTGDVCCGLTWITTGQLDQARRVLLRTLTAPELAGEEPIVVLEPSCAATLRRDLAELLPHDPRARSVARRVSTFAELLDGVDLPMDVRTRDGAATGAGSEAEARADAGAGTGPGAAAGAGAAATIAEAGRALVQPHCHQQAVLGTDADRRLMDRAGITTPSVLAGCCGLAGNFGAERGHEAVSRAVAELALLPALDVTGPDDLILADGFSCRTQIAFLGGRRAQHLAEVLADRLVASGDDPAWSPEPGA